MERNRNGAISRGRAAAAILSLLVAAISSTNAQLKVYDFEGDLLPSYSSADTRFDPLTSPGMTPIDMLKMAVPGNPGQDYPIFAEVPDTSFSCDGRVDGGYYADTEADCQPFHVCANNGYGGFFKYSFLCPNGTLFNQEYFICDWWFNVDCSQAENLYRLNDDLAADRPITGAASSPKAYQTSAPTGGSGLSTYGNTGASARAPHQPSQRAQTPHSRPAPRQRAQPAVRPDTNPRNSYSNTNAAPRQPSYQGQNQNQYRSRTQNRPAPTGAPKRNNYGASSNVVEHRQQGNNNRLNNYSRNTNKKPQNSYKARKPKPQVQTPATDYGVPLAEPVRAAEPPARDYGVPLAEPIAAQPPPTSYGIPQADPIRAEPPSTDYGVPLAEPVQAQPPPTDYGVPLAEPVSVQAPATDYGVPLAEPVRAVAPSTDYGIPQADPIVAEPPSTDYGVPQADPISVQAPSTDYGVPQADPISIQAPSTDYGIPQAEPISYDRSEPSPIAIAARGKELTPAKKFFKGARNRAKQNYNKPAPPSTDYGVPLAQPLGYESQQSDAIAMSYQIPQDTVVVDSRDFDPSPKDYAQPQAARPATGYGVPLSDPIQISDYNYDGDYQGDYAYDDDDLGQASQNDAIAKSYLPPVENEAVAPSTNYGIPQADPISNSYLPPDNAAAEPPSTDYGIPQADPIAASYLPQRTQQAEAPSTGYGLPSAEPISNSYASRQPPPPPPPPVAPSTDYGVPLAEPLAQDTAVAPPTSYGLPQAPVLGPSSAAAPAEAPSRSYLPAPEAPAPPATDYGLPLADPVSSFSSRRGHYPQQEYNQRRTFG